MNDIRTPYNFSNIKLGASNILWAQMRSAPIHHVLLKTERPAYVSILSVVRDAVARLPDGVGTRMDVTELAKDSQWLA